MEDDFTYCLSGADFCFLFVFWVCVCIYVVFLEKINEPARQPIALTMPAYLKERNLDRFSATNPGFWRFPLEALRGTATRLHSPYAAISARLQEDAIGTGSRSPTLTQHPNALPSSWRLSL